MPLSASDLLHNADAFRRAYPSWPSAEPEEHTCGASKTGGLRIQGCPRCDEIAAAEAEYARGRADGRAARCERAWSDPGSGHYGHGYDRGWWDADDELEGC